jgi:hypothetical protein
MKWSAALFPVLALTACLGVLDPGESRQLREAEERWEAAGIDDYTFEMRTSCFCPPEIYEWAVVEVRDGVVVGAKTLDGEPLASWGLTSRKTVEQLFDVAHGGEDWIEDIDFQFDEELGYPRRIELISSRNVADAGAVYEARNLVRSLVATR